MVLQCQHIVDKYLTVILMFLFVGIPLSFVNPATGEFRNPPFYGMFYASIGGICVIFIYGSYRDRKARQKANRRRRNKE